MSDDDKPSIPELKRVDLKCGCGGMFAREHNEARGCPRHGSLSSDVAARERVLDAAPVLLEIAAAALELQRPCSDSRCGSIYHYEGCPRNAIVRRRWESRLKAALAKVRP